MFISCELFTSGYIFENRKLVLIFISPQVIIAHDFLNALVTEFTYNYYFDIVSAIVFIRVI